MLAVYGKTLKGWKQDTYRQANPSTFRIEDNILITKTGSHNFTTTVKDVEEMENIISSS